jgi:hypothetical protein
LLHCRRGECATGFCWPLEWEVQWTAAIGSTRTEIQPSEQCRWQS